MKKSTQFVLFFLLCLCSSYLVAQNLPERTLVFDMNYDGSKYYRIPALTVAADKSLIAVVDKRGNSLQDLPNTISIVSRRSTDYGKTWSAPVVVAQGGNGKTYGDPAVVLDKNSGHLLCIFVGDQGLWTAAPSNRQGIYISKSMDNGISWSAPRAITDQIYKEHSDWYAAFAGSGNALQLRDGRLMFVLAVRPDSRSNGPLYNYVCYSDDGGDTWDVSGVAETIGDEAKVVELENGDILMSIRNPNKGYRKFCKSTDRGETWGRSYMVSDLDDPACNGDIVRYSYSSDGQSCLLHSLPASSTTRENVTVYLSYDEGQSWKVKRQLFEGYSAYSSLAVLPDGSIGALVEEGKWDSSLLGDDGFKLAFYRFTMDWLTGNAEPAPQVSNTLQLNGVDRYMRIPNAEELNPQIGGTFTVTCKVKMGFTGSTCRFVAKRSYEGTNNSGTTGYELWGDGSGNTKYSVNLSPQGDPWGGKGHGIGISFPENTWAHLTWVYDAVNNKTIAYVDGVEKENKTLDGAFKTKPLANNFDILVGAGWLNENGALSVPSYFMDGEMDDVRFYSKALTREEVIADMTSVVGENTEGLIAAYDFANISGTTVPDISGHGHDGILVNFPDVASRYPVTITSPDEVQGTLKVLNGDAEVISGINIAENTILTVEAIPTEGYRLKSILINGTPLPAGVNTFTVTGITTVTVEFERLEDAGPEYCIPAGTKINERYLTAITSVGAKEGTEEINYTANAPLAVVYTKLNQSLTVEQSSTFTISFVGNNAASNGLKYTHAEIFADWNGDGDFTEADGERVAMVGECAPSVTNNWNNGERMENIVQEFRVPADAKIGKTCIRIKYTDAWHNRKNPSDPAYLDGPCSEVDKGMVYDIPVMVEEHMQLPRTVLIETPSQIGAHLDVYYRKSGSIMPVVVNSGDKIEIGTKLIIDAYSDIPNKLQLVSVKVNGEDIKSVDGTYTYTVMEGKDNIMISAEFATLYGLTIDEPQNGSIEVRLEDSDELLQNGDKIQENAVVLIKPISDENYKVSSLKINGYEQIGFLEDGIYKHQVTKDLRISVSFKRVHTLTMGKVENGVIEVRISENGVLGELLGNDSKVEDGVVLSIKPVANDGYELHSLLLNDNEIKDLLSDGVYLQTVKKNIVIDAEFSLVSSLTNEWNNGIHIYPNPFIGSFMVNGISAGSLIQIYNMSGVCVFSKVAGAKTLVVHSTEFMSGIYILKLTDNNESRDYKLVKK